MVFTQKAYGVELIAHRANSGDFKENTLEAIASSWKYKADAVEIDVRMSKDHVVYLFHDETINGSNVDLYTHNEMQSFDPTIPKLSSVLNLDIPLGYYILDLKDESSEFIAVLTSLIQESNFPIQKLSFQSANISVLSKIRETLPKSQYIYLSKLKRKRLWFHKPSSSELFELLAKNNISAVSLKGRQFIDITFIESLKLKGIKVLIWNINSLERVEYYTSLGVDGIITDRLLEIRSN